MMDFFSTEALVLGGLFLLGKATWEIHHKIEHASDPESAALGITTLKAVLTQVLIVQDVDSDILQRDSQWLF